MADDVNDDVEQEDEIEEGAENAEGEDGGDKKKLIIIVAGVVVLLLAVGAGLFFTGVIGGSDEAVAEESHEGGEGDHADDKGKKDDHGKSDKKGKKDKKGKDDHGKGGKKGKEAGEGYGSDSGFLAIPTMNISLNTDDGAPRYLRLSVQLELNDPADAPAVEAVMPRVVDKFQTYLRELRVKDLRGSGGIYRLQMELLWRVNQAAAPVEVKDVLFQEILIQ